MQLTATLRLSQPAVLRHGRVARPVKAFSAASAYLGQRIEQGRMLGGLTQLPSQRRPQQRRSGGGGAGQPVRASFLGVGAPEAILVGVVALVVFGPKGLAQAAKGLGNTLRAFAPTIRELTSVSQELKSTLENEIGINEIKEELSRPAVPTPRPARAEASADGTSSSSSDGEGQQGAALSQLAETMQQSKDTMASVIDPGIERKRAEAAAAAWGGAAPSAAAAMGPAAATGAAGGEAAGSAAGSAAGAAAAPQAGQAVRMMTLEELEAELARRKAKVSGGQLPQELSADD